MDKKLKSPDEMLRIMLKMPITTFMIPKIKHTFAFSGLLALTTPRIPATNSAALAIIAIITAIARNPPTAEVVALSATALVAAVNKTELKRSINEAMIEIAPKIIERMPVTFNILLADC